MILHLCERIILADKKLHCVLRAEADIVAKARHYKRLLSKSKLIANDRVLHDLGVTRFTQYNDMPFWCFDDQYWLFFTPRGIPLATPFLEKEVTLANRRYLRISTSLIANYPSLAQEVLHDQSVVMSLSNFDEKTVERVFTMLSTPHLKPFLEQTTHPVDAAVTLIFTSSLIAGRIIAEHELGNLYKEFRWQTLTP